MLAIDLLSNDYISLDPEDLGPPLTANYRLPKLARLFPAEVTRPLQETPASDLEQLDQFMTITILQRLMLHI